MTTALVPTTQPVVLTETRVRTQRPLWQAGLAAGAVAATANLFIAAAARGLDVSLAVTNGHTAKPIPVAGFASLTLLGAVVGLLLAAGARRVANRPAPRFVRLAMLGTLVSLVPDAMSAHDTATMLVLWLTHLVAAAIIVPVLAARLPAGDRR